MSSAHQGPSSFTAWIKEQALAAGFLTVGITKVVTLDAEAERLKAWLDKGYNGEMHYMANHFDLRKDPRLLVDGAQSVICLSFNYHPEDDSLSTTAPKIARYAYGRDYHKVVKKKMINLLKEMQVHRPDLSGRAFVDSAPVMEREWAKRAGLGWVGKNTLIIHPKKGSYFFLGVIIIDQALDYDAPISDHCGTCTRCIDACPTEAIAQEGYELNAAQCISYATIELKTEKLPADFDEKMEGWAFGCDICQEVCPWNKFSTPHTEADFYPSDQLKDMTAERWAEMTQEDFDHLFFGTPVKRTGYEWMKRNIAAATKKV
jgi:epoxyqueuosine reductase